MRINEMQLLAMSKEAGRMEGIMQYLPPQDGRDFKQYWQSSNYKVRRFKLHQNLLFYYRADVNETEPVGVIILENIQVSYENENPNILFAFSLNGADGKHILVCRCQEDVNKWVTELKKASYLELRMQQMIATTKLRALCQARQQPNATNIFKEDALSVKLLDLD